METGPPVLNVLAMVNGPAEDRIRHLLAAGDDARAVTELLRELGPAVNRYLVSLLRDELDAAEAFSIFAETIWKALPSFRGEASLRTWSFRIAWTAARGLRRSAWRRHHERLRTRDASLLAEETRTKSVVRLERQRSALARLRTSLSLQERSLLALRIDQELSWSEIAAVLGTPERPVDAAAVMKRFERLKQRLARMARDEGLLD